MSEVSFEGKFWRDALLKNFFDIPVTMKVTSCQKNFLPRLTLKLFLQNIFASIGEFV